MITYDTNSRIAGPHRRFWIAGICGVLIAGGAACSDCSEKADRTDATPARPATAPTSGMKTVSMQNIQFSLQTVEIKRGDVVEWKNDDLVPHTATSASFDSGTLNPGESWRHTFNEAGVFPYACAFHSHMKGVVVVK